MGKDRRLDQHPLPGIGIEKKCEIKSGYYAGNEENMFRRDLPSVEPQKPLTNHPYKLVARPDVPEYPVVHPLAECLNNRLGRDKIHVCDPQGDGVVPIPLPLKAVGTLSFDGFIKIVSHLHAITPKFVSVGPDVHHPRLGRVEFEVSLDRIDSAGAEHDAFR